MKYVIVTADLLTVKCYRCKNRFRRLGDVVGVVETVNRRKYFHSKCIVKRNPRAAVPIFKPSGHTLVRARRRRPERSSG